LALSDEVLVRVVGNVQIITINRPEVRNAINFATAEGLAKAFAQLDANDDVSVGVLTGEGSSFSSGMDLKAFLAGERSVVGDRGFAGIVERAPEKPVIAAVEGAALAGGFEIVLACDLIVAANNAFFGLPEVKRGLVASGGGLLRLPDRVPYHLAMEWSLTGSAIPATTAYEVHLVNRLTSPGEALSVAVGLGEEISANGPLAIRASKSIITGIRDWKSEFARQAELGDSVRLSEDAREGARAFVEKRAAVWRGL
jgi:enoyl-CoA hydratase